MRLRTLWWRKSALAAGAVVVAAAVLWTLVGRGGDPPPPWPPLPGATAQGVVTDTGEVIIELRVWQHVEDPFDVWIRARPSGGRGETLDRISFRLDRSDGASSLHGFHSYRDLGILIDEVGAAVTLTPIWKFQSYRGHGISTDGVVGTRAELRLWQRYRKPEFIHARVCVTPCSKRGVSFGQSDFASSWRQLDSARWPWQTHRWDPLGMIALPLEDGHSEFDGSRYRYGDFTIAVAAGNPGLSADREHLLALRDALAGSAKLNWDAGTRTSEWEGVTVTGTPPRVTGLHLADRGLDGEIWGWLGDLTELMELRLDGNRLTGTIPSKLARLRKLTVIGVSGNELQGCVPPPLREVAYHDGGVAGLPVCGPPILLTTDGSSRNLRGVFELNTKATGVSYRWGEGGTIHQGIGKDPIEFFFFLILDVPSGVPVRISDFLGPLDERHGSRACPPCGYGNARSQELRGTMVRLSGHGTVQGDPWLLLRYDEIERSHYDGDDPVISAIFDRIMASLWINTAIDFDHRRWADSAREETLQALWHGRRLDEGAAARLTQEDYLNLDIGDKDEWVWP